jgi:glycosyltransferase involved in cell wall biosynthesis
MRVLHLSTSDVGGGAARAAFRLHTGLLRLGVDSRMLVLKRQSGESTVTKLKWSGDLPTRLRRSWRAKAIKRDFAPYKSTLPPGFELFSDDRSEAGYDLVRQLGDSDIINLHWVAGLIDHEIFFSHLPAKIPLVWRLADMGALTGGCHYDNGCGKFTAKCGACPAIGSTTEDDLSRQIWLRKSSALAKIETNRMHLVGTSRWIAAEAKRSSLLGRFASTIIPNGLDISDFAPRDKGFSRDTLGVPRDKKVVLFVADTATNKRKGFDYLARALEGLKSRSDLFLLSVGGHSPSISGLPLLHLGHISNDRMLSVIYSAADVFVIPSLQESFGQTVTESLACGTPVVGFDTGGIPDMVRPGITGYLAPVGNADELGVAIVKVLDDPAKVVAMSADCRQIALREYSLEVQAQSYLAFYETLLSRTSESK